MIDFSNDNSFNLKTYKIDYHNDGIISVLMNGESVRFSFYNDTTKVFLSDKRIIIEESGEKLQYSFVGLNTLDYFQMEAKELARRMSEVALTFGLRGGGKLSFTIEDEVDPMQLHGTLSSKIFQ